MSMPSGPENAGSNEKSDPPTYSQDFQIANVGARVPEKVSRGVFATGVLVFQGKTEFVLDFALRMNKPHQVVARIILPFNLVPQFIEALKANLEKYQQSFGTAPPSLPKPAATTPPASPPTIEEIYEDLKIPDDVMVGAYANSVMISHSAAEFCLEFILNFYPKAVISSRVFLSAPQVPALLNSLSQSWNNFQAKLKKQPFSSNEN